jgi:ornithine cyclodeaminase
MRYTLSKLSKMFLLGEKDVQKALSLQDCLDVNRKALQAIINKTAFVPSRLGLPYPSNPNIATESTSTAAAEDWTLIKPAAYYGAEGVAMGLKVVGVRANNPSKGLPLVPATILLLDAATGIVQATLGGTYVSVARTSAGPGLAVQAFKPDVEHLVVFGAGAQAECHIEIMEVAIQRQIQKITIINRSKERAESLKEKLFEDGQRKSSVEVVLLSDAEGVAAALAEADVISTTTNTTDPLWKDKIELKKGCLITGIGSYTPKMKEVPEYVVNRSHVVIDTPETMSVGDLKHLGDYGSSAHPITLAGDALTDPGKIVQSTDYIFYKAVGTAIQDVLTAQIVVERARDLGLGQEVDMS